MELYTNNHHSFVHTCRLPMIGTMYRAGLFSEQNVNKLRPAISQAIMAADHANLGPGNYGQLSHITAVQHAFASAGLHIESVPDRSRICCSHDIDTALHTLCNKILEFCRKYPVFYQDFQTEAQCMSALRGFAQVIEKRGCVFTHC